MVKQPSGMLAYLQYASMGIQMVVVMGSCMWIGMQLDRQLALQFPIFLSLLSVGSTVFCIYRTIRKLLKQIQKERYSKSID